MNTVQKILAGLCIIAVPLLNACGNNDPAPCDYVLETQQEQEAFTAALNAYAADPTNVTKCNAYKNAYQAYLNDLQEHDNCVLAGQNAAYQQALNDAQDSINNIQC